MRKPIYSLLVMALVFGCAKPDPGTDPDVANLRISKNYLPFDNTGGEESFTVESNLPWQYRFEGDGANWITLTPESGESGTTEVTVTVDSSPLSDERSASIRFTSGDEYKRLDIFQNASGLALSLDEMSFPFTGDTAPLIVSTNIVDWSHTLLPAGVESWCTVQKSGDNALSVKVSANEVATTRTATLRITAGDMTKEVAITQSPYSDLLKDKMVFNLQRATIGRGVNLVLAGDGYTAADMSYSEGKYASDIRAAVDHFCSVWPYSGCRDYFNVWMVVAVSGESGVSIPSAGQYVNTAFGCEWVGGNGTGITCSDAMVDRYARLIAPAAGRLPNEFIRELTMIITINADIYAGTCRFSDVTGFSYAMIPANTLTAPDKTFQALVVHEAGGHGFGKLGDEYVYEKNLPLPENSFNNYDRSTLIRMKSAGAYANLDLHGNMSETTWADFADYPDYDMVRTFEGALMYGKGVWRPEQSSTMNLNELYFNAPSRYDIVRRIMAWSDEDEDYSLADFVAWERGRIPAYPSSTRVSAESFIPLGRPIISR